MQSDKRFESVVVTGGCGFYGYHFIRRILELEPTCAVTVLDIDISEKAFPNSHYHQCDISDKSRLREIFEHLKPPPRIVIHAACPSSIVRNDERFWRVNVGGTDSLLELSRSVGVKAFVFTSSSGVVHDNETDLIEADETMPILRPPQQKTVYTYTKAVAEEHVLAANRKGGMLTVSLRSCTTFGPHNPAFTGRMVTLAKSGKTRFQMGDGNIWDFMYIGNMVHACLLSVERLLQASDAPPLPTDQRVEGEAFMLADGERMTFWDFPLAVSAAMGKPVKPEEIRKIPKFIALITCFLSQWGVWLFSLGRKQSVMVREGVVFAYITRTLNINKATKVLGYQPVVSFQEGLKETVAWYMEHDKKDQ
ncbi:uncharacterized protein K452DRAFT_258195 [Aplosporella prunicola CBS 121167]|uniref:3-beta hydroxysteroid dehydrogenase/isomerase domain-containing protein n=1 Tax=Aplosporella prunicola CBS 121167 TaxID=1176127 RepID=A0A6A6B1F7_9PEZI|nr:uncharacterized protein K452DRAFT_258195 [Aplosporella prunicola CBS 121167]KAF2137095.1 hypothetical protein K452DRAFT_258195 [Aplosporella prunicola CBS 121167]